MKIYTDGAVSNNGKKKARGGWAFVVLDNSYSESGYIPKATNQIAELTAVLSACKYAIKNMNGFPQSATIYSDSAYVVNCFKDRWYRKWIDKEWKNSKRQAVANKELWQELVPFFEDNRFDFVKVKGHAEDPWNILVDKLAVAAKSLEIT